MPENPQFVPIPNGKSANSLDALPPHLVAYFRGTGDGHLKVLGTISSEGPNKPIDWAVFASKKKGMPNGDPDFKGKSMARRVSRDGRARRRCGYFQFPVPPTMPPPQQ